MGRPAKSQKQKQLEGTDRPDRKRSAAPEFSNISEIPKPPARLCKIGAEVWVMLCDQLITAKLLKLTDLIVLGILVDAVVSYYRYCEKLKGRDELILTPRGEFKINPYIKLRKQAAETIRTISNDFGLTPLARQKLTSLEKQDDTPDPFAFIFDQAEDV